MCRLRNISTRVYIQSPAGIGALFFSMESAARDLLRLDLVLARNVHRNRVVRKEKDGHIIIRPHEEEIPWKRTRIKLHTLWETGREREKTQNARASTGFFYFVFFLSLSFYKIEKVAGRHSARSPRAARVFGVFFFVLCLGPGNSKRGTPDRPVSLSLLRKKKT